MESLKFEYSYKIPTLTASEIEKYSSLAHQSIRKRYPLIMHKQGDYFNQVFNFVLKDSYMTPHLHPETKMIEKMHLISGSFNLLFFNSSGKVTNIFTLDKPDQKVQVPSGTWHTYVMTSELTIVYETMLGVYKPETWKKIPDWAPKENSIKAKQYLNDLKKFK